MECNCLASIIRNNTENYFLLLKDASEKNRFIGKGLISVHGSNKDCSSASYNSPIISCRLYAMYHFDVLAGRSSNIFVTTPSSHVKAYRLY